MGDSSLAHHYVSDIMIKPLSGKILCGPTTIFFSIFLFLQWWSQISNNRSVFDGAINKMPSTILFEQRSIKKFARDVHNNLVTESGVTPAANFGNILTFSMQNIG